MTLAASDKFNKSVATHFVKFPDKTHIYKVVQGRLYVWVLDRWMYECWVKHFPHTLSPL